MSRATEQAIADAIHAHLTDLRAGEEDPEDRKPGLLTAWVVMTECLTSNHTDDGSQIYRTGYICPDISPAQAVGAARNGLRSLEHDMSPE